MKRFLMGLAGAVLLTGFGLTSEAFAGPQYVDKTGFAVSGYDVVALHQQPQAPVGKAQAAAVPGKASITVEYNGAKWAFASEANRDAFQADPAKYAPAYDGHCAYGAAVGGKVPANPHLWRVVDGKLYLNITKVVVGFWEKDIPGFIGTANKNWQSKLVSKPSAVIKVPDLDTAAAPL